MRQCTYCGAELAEEAMVCAACGRPLEEAMQQTAEAAPIVTEEPVAEPFVCEVAPVAKKRKLWPWITAGIVLLLAAIAALYFFVLRKPEPTAKERLTAAMETTVSDAKTIFANTVNLRENVKTLQGMGKESAYVAFDFLLDGPDDEGSELNSIGMKLSANLDRNGDVLAEGDIDLNIDMYENKLPLTLHFALDRKELQLSMPKYVDEVYSLPFEDLKELLELDEEPPATLGEALMPMKPVNVEALKTQLRQLWDTAVFTDITKTVTELPIEGEAKLYSCYQVVFDKEQLAQLFDKLTEVMQANDPNFEAEWPEIESAIFHVYQGKVVGMEILHTYDSESHRDGLWLKGENNPWERVEATADGEPEDGVLFVEATEQGVKLRMETEEGTISFDYNDSDCTVVITRSGEDFAGQEIRLWLREKDEGLELALDMQIEDVNAAIGVEIAPMQAAPERLSEEAENLMDMSQQDLEKLLVKILLELVTDPETSWILDAIQGAAA